MTFLAFIPCLRKYKNLKHFVSDMGKRITVKMLGHILGCATHTQAIYTTCQPSFLFHTVWSGRDLQRRLWSLLTALHDHKRRSNEWELQWRGAEWSAEINISVYCILYYLTAQLELTVLPDHVCLYKISTTCSHEAKWKLFWMWATLGRSPPVRSSLRRLRGHCGCGLHAVLSRAACGEGEGGGDRCVTWS